MATTKRPTTIRLSDDNYAKLKSIANKNRRSMANQLEFLLEQYVMEYESKFGKIGSSDNTDDNRNLHFTTNHQINNNNIFIE